MQSHALQSQKGLTSTQHSRLTALKAKHAALSEKIEQERKHSYQSDGLIAQLKKQKLVIKEEIEGIRVAS